MRVLKTGERIATRYPDKPVILRQGFRIFFLAAAVWAMLVMAVFVAMLSGTDVILPAFDAVDWHIHELLFGYTGAVIAGFLLTAVPNWTRRLPVSGWRLLVLFLLWVAGRFAVAFSSGVDPALVAAFDLAFPVWLVFVIARELVAGRNYRNLRVLVLVTLFGAANLAFHVEAAFTGTTDYSRRAGIAVVIVLITLIGGRIIPSFTRNWLVQQGRTTLPVPFGRYDGMTLIVSALTLACWTLFPGEHFTALLLSAAGVLNLLRLVRWQGHRTLGEGLLVILHVAYLFIPLGMLALATSIIAPHVIPAAGALHLLTAGAIAMMTVAVMSRASLGHTGQTLHADALILAIYVALAGSVLLRLFYAIAPGAELLHASALMWGLSYVAFLFRFGAMAIR
ncbi:MAG: NnrS family protein [Hyphomicrobiales bacterium]|nr:NnrS family protein [Hyphomicrobiales bacterium]